MNIIAFDNKFFFFIQKVKKDFVCFMWFESKLFLNDCPVILVRLFFFFNS